MSSEHALKKQFVEPSRSWEKTLMGCAFSSVNTESEKKTVRKFAKKFSRWIVPEIKRSQCPKLPPSRSCNAEGRILMLMRLPPRRRDSKIFEGYHVC